MATGKKPIPKNDRPHCYLCGDALRLIAIASPDWKPIVVWVSYGRSVPHCRTCKGAWPNGWSATGRPSLKSVR